MSGYAHRGKGWEAKLDSQHGLYQWRGEAYVQRNYPPIRVLRRAGPGKSKRAATFMGVWDGPGPPDFTIVSHGVTFVADAKACSSGPQSSPSARWPFASLHEHQAEAFDHAEKQGAVALVLLWHAGVRECYALLWRDLGPLWHEWQRLSTFGARASPGTASLSPAQLDALSCWHSRSYDWLPAVLRALQEEGG